MTLEWLAIEERVPKVTDAVRQATPAGEHAAPASHLVQVIAAALADEPRKPLWLVAPSRRVARQWIDTLVHLLASRDMAIREGGRARDFAREQFAYGSIAADWAGAIQKVC